MTTVYVGRRHRAARLHLRLQVRALVAAQALGAAVLAGLVRLGPRRGVLAVLALLTAVAALVVVALVSSAAAALLVGGAWFSVTWSVLLYLAVMPGRDRL